MRRRLHVRVLDEVLTDEARLEVPVDMVLFLFRVAVERAEEFSLFESIYTSFGSPANHFYIECFVLRDLFSGDSLE